jgi:hypothetical protein
MGRGRQKAKHTKVARELKYFSPEVDLTALERELGHPDENELVDKWADMFPEEDDTDGAAGTEAQDAAVDGDAAGDAGSADAGSADAGSADA